MENHVVSGENEIRNTYNPTKNPRHHMPRVKAIKQA